MDLAYFYNQAERYLRQKKAKAENVEINVVDDSGPSMAEVERIKKNVKLMITSRRTKTIKNEGKKIFLHGFE